LNLDSIIRTYKSTFHKSPHGLKVKNTFAHDSLSPASVSPHA